MPDIPINVIGDIHGCLPQLQDLMSRLDPDVLTVCVGDYVDRGINSAGVLQWLHDHPHIICLRGNHEDMMQGFLDAPERKGPRWLKYGGVQTLESFDILHVTDTSPADTLVKARDALVAAMGPDLLDWFGAMPTRHLSGNVAIVHAGADPRVPMDKQADKTLIWGHRAFETQPRPDGIWVIYGHTIMVEPDICDGRIGIDTGAYASGQLTAICLDPSGSYRFIIT